MQTTPTRAGLVACAIMLLFLAPARAQEAMYTQAATMPGPGTAVLREQVHFFRFGQSPLTGARQEDKLEVSTGAQIGLARALSLTVDVPISFSRSEDASGDVDSDKGVEDIDLMLKYRVFMDNPGGIDTTRVALLGGAMVTSGDDRDFASQSVSPHVGAVFTAVRGRHGFNQDLLFTLTTGGTETENSGGEGPAEALAFDSAYVYRLAPGAFTSESAGAWYATAEVNGLYETNGDVELRWAPGIMYEGREWGLEIMAQFPLWNELDHRAELDFGIGVGVRVLF